MPLSRINDLVMVVDDPSKLFSSSNPESSNEVGIASES